MNNTDQLYVNHEVRIQLLEKIAEKIDQRFERIDQKIESHFHWMLGTQIATLLAIISLFGAVIITKLI